MIDLYVLQRSFFIEVVFPKLSGVEVASEYFRPQTRILCQIMPMYQIAEAQKPPSVTRNQEVDV